MNNKHIEGAAAYGSPSSIFSETEVSIKPLKTRQNYKKTGRKVYNIYCCQCYNEIRVFFVSRLHGYLANAAGFHD